MEVHGGTKNEEKNIPIVLVSVVTLLTGLALGGYSSDQSISSSNEKMFISRL